MGKACCGPGPDVERLQAEQRYIPPDSWALPPNELGTSTT